VNLLLDENVPAPITSTVKTLLRRSHDVQHVIDLPPLPSKYKSEAGSGSSGIGLRLRKGRNEGRILSHDRYSSHMTGMPARLCVFWRYSAPALAEVTTTKSGSEAPRPPSAPNGGSALPSNRTCSRGEGLPR
jgi:hypothetical protein